MEALDLIQEGNHVIFDEHGEKKSIHIVSRTGYVAASIPGNGDMQSRFQAAVGLLLLQASVELPLQLLVSRPQLLLTGLLTCPQACQGWQDPHPGWATHRNALGL